MNPIIEIKNLSFGYKKNKLILEDLSISFQEGRIIVLLGKNGCGKSTLLDCILGVNKYSGEILVDGKEIDKYSSKELATVISFIPQNLQINIDYSIREFISFGLNPHLSLFESISKEQYDLIEKNAQKSGIAELLDEDINKVSGGERQLAFIARALTQNAKIIIMDEPTSALDFGNQQKLFKIIKEISKEGKTIIFTTHNPNHLINLDCDIYSIIHGKIQQIEKLDLNVMKELYDDDFIFDGQAFTFKI